MCDHAARLVHRTNGGICSLYLGRPVDCDDTPASTLQAPPTRLQISNAAGLLSMLLPDEACCCCCRCRLTLSFKAASLKSRTGRGHRWSALQVLQQVWPALALQAARRPHPAHYAQESAQAAPAAARMPLSRQASRGFCPPHASWRGHIHAQSDVLPTKLSLPAAPSTRWCDVRTHLLLLLLLLLLWLLLLLLWQLPREGVWRRWLRKWRLSCCSPRHDHGRSLGQREGLPGHRS